MFFILLLCSPKISKKGSVDFATAVGFYFCPSGSSVILNHLPKQATCAAYTLAQRIILLAPGKWTSVVVEHCQWLSNRLLKKPKAADKKEEAEDMVALKKQLDDKSAECTALKGQVAELQQSSVSIVEALSTNRVTFCKVSITMLHEHL